MEEEHLEDEEVSASSNVVPPKIRKPRISWDPEVQSPQRSHAFTAALSASAARDATLTKKGFTAQVGIDPSEKACWEKDGWAAAPGEKRSRKAVDFLTAGPAINKRAAPSEPAASTIPPTKTSQPAPAKKPVPPPGFKFRPSAASTASASPPATQTAAHQSQRAGGKAGKAPAASSRNAPWRAAPSTGGSSSSSATAISGVRHVPPPGSSSAHESNACVSDAFDQHDEVGGLGIRASGSSTSAQAPSAQAPSAQRPPVLERVVPPPKPPRPPKTKPSFVEEAYVPRAHRQLPKDDPEGWVTDGWCAAEGVKRVSMPVLESEEPRAAKRRETDPAALAALAAARAAYEERFVVGARVEARFQATLNVKWKTFWFKGSIDAVHGDGTFAIRYDDGDYEPIVKRRFVRLLKASPSARPSGASADTRKAGSRKSGSRGAGSRAAVRTGSGHAEEEEEGEEEEEEAYEYDEYDEFGPVGDDLDSWVYGENGWTRVS